MGTHHRYHLHEHSHHQRGSLCGFLCPHRPRVSNWEGDATQAGHLCDGEHCPGSAERGAIFTDCALPAGHLAVPHLHFVLQDLLHDLRVWTVPRPHHPAGGPLLRGPAGSGDQDQEQGGEGGIEGEQEERRGGDV